MLAFLLIVVGLRQIVGTKIYATDINLNDICVSASYEVQNSFFDVEVGISKEIEEPEPIEETEETEVETEKVIVSENVEVIVENEVEVVENTYIPFIFNEDILSEADLTIPEGFTEEDLRMLACMVYNENGKCQNDVKVIFADNPENPVMLPCHIMHQWTAQVCLNHIKDSRFPNTIYGDLDLPRYTPAYRLEEEAIKAQNENPDVWKDVVYDCLLAMNGLVDLPSNVIYESNYTELGTHYADVYVDTGYFSSWSYFSIG